MKEQNPIMMYMINKIIWECQENPDKWADGRTTQGEWAQHLIDWDVLGYVKVYDC